ncbi:MAG: hypothetical protein SVY53_07745 [Chloroflexota bacterium]|nr:hypothetical protein [Chloroflexota bacterium]
MKTSIQSGDVVVVVGTMINLRKLIDGMKGQLLVHHSINNRLINKEVLLTAVCSLSIFHFSVTLVDEYAYYQNLKVDVSLCVA